VWERFGDVPNYVEPFAGSLAVLLLRPSEPGTETVNDLDCFLANFWRAVQADPKAVAGWADWPVNEADLHARHRWLVGQAEFAERMKREPDFYDAKIAGWWVWGLCAWIGSGWCRERGDGTAPEQLPHLGNAGMGLHRKLPHLGDAGMGDVHEKRPMLGGHGGGNGFHRKDADAVASLLVALTERLRRVRVCCGDWTRVMGDSVTWRHGVTGVFLDPPYGGDAGRAADLYSKDCPDVAGDVRRWAVENGDNPELRIALCGYEGEHEMPESWPVVEWKAKGGYGGQRRDGTTNDNAGRERIWFSPACHVPGDGPPFAGGAA
jgi:hypothetical protein